MRITDLAGATRSTIITQAPQQKVVSYTYYRVTDGDTIQAIANKALGNPALWWKIADVNPEILAWYDLAPGIIIRIPS